MDDRMILQAQMHQGQSHFATAHIRLIDAGALQPDFEVDAQVGPHGLQGQQQPFTQASDEVKRDS